jgi:putative membrane protein
MKNIIIFIKGFIFGTANIIPGVSGGTMAITLGIYEKLLDILGHFLDDVKENIKFIVPFILGIAVAVLVMSNVISYALSNYNFATILFFIGLILGGLPLILKKVDKNDIKNNYYYFIIGFMVVILMTIVKSSNVSSIDLEATTFITLFFVGVIASSAMIIPGISGSFVLILLGYYEPIINVIKDLFNFSNIIFNVSILFFFGIGVLAGIVFISRLIKKLLKDHPKKTYFTIIGFVMGSIFSIIYNMSAFNYPDVIFGIPLFILGVFIASRLGE